MFDGARAGLTDTVDALLANLKALGSLDAAGCSESELAAAAVDLHNAQAMLAAHSARVDRAFANTRRWQADGARSPKAWLADRTGEDARTCARSLRLGRICSALSKAAAAWEAGEITSDHLRRLAAARNQRTAGRLAIDEQLLVDKAKVLPYAEFDQLMT